MKNVSETFVLRPITTFQSPVEESQFSFLEPQTCKFCHELINGCRLLK